MEKRTCTCNYLLGQFSQIWYLTKKHFKPKLAKLELFKYFLKFSFIFCWFSCRSYEFWVRLYWWHSYFPQVWTYSVKWQIRSRLLWAFKFSFSIQNVEMGVYQIKNNNLYIFFSVLRKYSIVEGQTPLLI